MRSIPGFPGYFVTAAGEVWSLRNGKLRELKPYVDKDGYYRVRLYTSVGCSRKKAMGKGIHRLVLETFSGPSDLTVNHKDGVKSNNTLENLEYLTSQENLKHAFRMGLSLGGQRGMKSNLTKHSDEKIAQIMALKGEMSGYVVGKLMGVSHSYVCTLWLGKKSKRGVRIETN